MMSPPPEPLLSTDEAVSKLMDLLAVHQDHESILRARLKHFQRLGFPPDVNVGGGRSGRFGLLHMFGLAVAFRLEDAGVAPELIVDLLKGEGHSLRNFFIAACSTPAHLVVFPSALQRFEQEQRKALPLHLVPQDELPDFFERVGFLRRGLVIVPLILIVRWIAESVFVPTDTS